MTSDAPNLDLQKQKVRGGLIRGIISEAKVWAIVELMKPLPAELSLTGIYIKEKIEGKSNVCLVFSDGSTMVI